MNDCYVQQLLDDGDFELLEGLTEKYEPCEEVEYGRVVVCSNEDTGCVEAYGHA